MIPVLSFVLSSLKVARLSFLTVLSLFIFVSCNPVKNSYDMSATSVSPSSGPLDGGFDVTITGSGFNYIEGVTFAGIPCTNLQVLSESELSCTVPENLSGGTVPVVVHGSANRTATTSFTYIGVPSITSVTPAYGRLAGGTTITIHGTGFTNGSTVLIGGSPCTSPVATGGTVIQCVIPSMPSGTYDIDVTNSIGVTDTLTASFSYSPFPVITGVSPSSGVTTGNTTITLTGTDFLPGAKVKLGALFCNNVTVVSSTSITCTTPANSAGLTSVSVINIDTQSDTLSNSFTYALSPFVSTVTPSAGALGGGTLVTINGSDFVSGATVSIGGSSCTPVTFVNQGQLTCTTTANVAGVTSVQVTNPSTFSYTLANSYTYEAGPAVTSVSPSSGPLAGGQTLTITGTGFLSGATVKIGTATCGTVSVLSSTSITCKTGSNVTGTYAVTVTNRDAQTGSLAGSYTYQPAPGITSISPNGGPLAGGTNITITGAGFVSGATVTIGGSSCTSLTVVSPTSITCTTPAAAAGAKNVVVTNTDTQSGTRVSGYFYADAPTVSSISPVWGIPTGGTTVTISGTGFLTGATVDLGGSACTSVSVSNSTTLTCTTGSHAYGSVTVTVTNPDTQSGASASSIFAYSDPPPTISSLSQVAGPIAGGTSLTISGSDFVAGATVDIGGSSCTVGTTTATSITCTTTAGSAGAQVLTVTNPDAQTGTTTFNYLNAPVISSVAPTGGAPAGGNTLTITGTDFFTGATVTVGGNPCTSVNVSSSTTITCTVPAGTLGAVDVVVTNVDAQTVTSTGAYTYANAPTISYATPNSGPMGGGTSISVIGTGFVSGATVTIGGNASTCTFGSSTTLNCTTPLSLVSGGVPIVVTNPDTQTATVSTGFIYLAAPTITSISPNNGSLAGGATATIIGTGFFSGATVTVGGAACTSVNVTSSTTLTCSLPSGSSGAQDVIVTNTDSQTVTLTGGFTYQGPPTVSGISPVNGTFHGGTGVTITGTGFISGAIVTIGSSTCTSIVVVDPNTITCTTTSGTAGTVNVVVLNPDSQTGTGSGIYTYDPDPAPAVTSISPARGALAGGTSVTISGSNFVSGATVDIGGAGCSSVAFVSSTTLTCTTNAQVAGVYGVTVTNPDTQTDTVAGLYTYQGAPTVTSLSPTGGPLAGGQTLTVTGTGFVSGATVSIGGASCGSVSVGSSTSLTCVTGASSAGTYNVVVTNNDSQSGTLTNGYIYRAAPTITTISPSGGALAGGTTLTITGTNFITGATVSIGGVACTSPSVSSTSITCTTGAQGAGAYSVVVDNNDTQTASYSSYTYRAAPTVTSVSPSSSPLAGGTTITVTGTGFVTGATVNIGGTGCTSVNVSTSTTLTCVTQSKAAGTYTLTVTNSDSQSGSLSSAVTYQGAPTVTSVSPSTGALAGGTSITISGSNFITGASVDFGGSPCTVGTVSSSSITCTTTAHAAGAVTVTVTNSDAQAGTRATAFTYQAAPTVSSVSPSSGVQAGGTAITITGTGFVSGASVSIGATSCSSVTVVNSTTITCTTPAGTAGAVTVSVLNADTQSGSLASGYTYTALPVLSFQTGLSSPNPPNPDNYGSTTTNVTHTFTLKNTGEAVSTAITTSISGADSAAFTFGTDNCSGNTLAVGASCTIQVTFLGGFMSSGTYTAVLNATAASGGTSTNNMTGTRP